MSELPTNGRIVPAALILSVSSLGSRLIGLIRERVFTTTFGAGDTFDAFVAAFRIPDLIFNLVVVGALSAAFIPLFMEKLVQGKEGTRQAFRFSLAVFNTVLVVVAVLSLLFAIFAGYLVPLITPGFQGEKLQLTVQLSRLMALQPVLLAASFVFSGILNSFHRFVAYSLAPILYNLGIIFGVLILVPRVGLAGLAWGVILGAILHVAVQFPSAVKIGFRWRPEFSWTSKDVKSLWRMFLPRVFGLAAQQINLLMVTIIGSTLLAGSITAFHLANNVQYLPVGLFGISFALAAFPAMAGQVARKEMQMFRGTLTHTLRYILFFVIPISVFFFLLRAQIIRVLFGDGAFDWEDTIITFETFGWLIVSIFAQATVPLLTRAFYVQRDTKTPVIISTISILVNIALALLLAPRWGVQGLALAFSVSAVVNMALLLGVLHWRLHGLDDKAVLGSVAKMSLATLVAAIVLQVLKYPVAAMVDMQRFWGVAIQMVVAGAGGGLVYLGMCWILKCEELLAVRRYLPRRLVPEAGVETARFGG